MTGSHRKSLQKYIPNLVYTVQWVHRTYAKGLDVRFEKVSKNTSIGHSTNGWPFIYEVHILYIVSNVLSLLAQVNVKSSACRIHSSAGIHLSWNNFHCTLVFPLFFHYW